MIDPWTAQLSENDINEELSKINGDINDESSTLQSVAFLGFEDSFIAENNNSHDEDAHNNSNSNQSDHQPLPDSEAYLKGLERKLDKLKKNSKLVDALSEKRDDCLRALVQNDLSDSSCNNDLLLDLEASIINPDSAVHNLFRQIQPVQPVTVGETVHIVNFDQLEEQRLELEAAAGVEATGEEEELPASR